MAVSVSRILIYPVKSCGSVSLDAAVVSDIGIEGDREWQFVDDDQNGVTQRQHRVLATVRPEPLSDGALRLRAAGVGTIDVEAGGPAVTVKSHFGLPVPATDAGDAAAAWFAELTGSAGRLVKMTDRCGWRLPDAYDLFEQPAPFSDAAPILVASQASCDWLAERAAEPFDIDRFRPNIVVAGTAPWDEDAWSTFTVGAASLHARVPWPRCQIPQIDQTTGDRHPEPAKVLRAHRWCADAPTVTGSFREIVEGNALFGIACSIAPTGAIVRVGDEVTVESTAPPVLTMP